MKYIKKFETYRYDYKKEEVVNEEIVPFFKSVVGFLKNMLSKAWNTLASSEDELSFCKNFKLEKDKFKKKVIEQIKAEKEKPSNLSTLIADVFLGEIDKEKISLKEGKDIPKTTGDFKEWKIYTQAFLEQLKVEWSELDAKYKNNLDFVNKEKLEATKKSLEEKINLTFVNLYKIIDNPSQRKGLIDKFKEDNKIKTEKLSQEILTSYEVKEVNQLKGKKVKYKTKEGKEASLPVKDIKETGIIFDGEKEDFEKPWSDILPAGESDSKARLQKTLGNVQKDPGKMDRIADVIDGVVDNEEKLKEVQDLLKNK